MNDPQPVLSHLLSISTQAQGDVPANKSFTAMPQEDREWLENAIQEASSSDPVKRLRTIIGDLNSTENSKADVKRISSLLEELDDLICDIDLALDFCKLGGLACLENLILPNLDELSIPTMHIIAELSQHNPRVQKYIIDDNTKFLETCLSTISNEHSQFSTNYKLKCLYVISSIVKDFSPAFRYFMDFGGSDKLLKCFEFSLQNDHGKLLHRCVITYKNILDSFKSRCEGSYRLPDDDGNFDVVKYNKFERLGPIFRFHLEQKNTDGRYSESLDYLSIEGPPSSDASASNVSTYSSQQPSTATGSSEGASTNPHQQLQQGNNAPSAGGPGPSPLLPPALPAPPPHLTMPIERHPAIRPPSP